MEEPLEDNHLVLSCVYGYALHCYYYKRLHAIYKLLTLCMQCTHC